MVYITPYWILQSKKDGAFSMNSTPVLSANIERLRKTLGLTQAEFAEQIGVKSLQISCVERGTKGLSLDRLMEICRKFHVCMDDLLPITEFDESLQEKWIGEIADYLRTVDAMQVGVLRRILVK